MKAMIFAAGLGTRLKTLTDTMPKAMVPVGGQPLIARTIRRLVAAGATEIVVNVHHFAEQVISYIETEDWGVPVCISDECECLLDTGGGLRRAAALFTPTNSPILIHNVDILSNACLQEFYAACCANAATLLVSERTTQRYLLFDKKMRLCGWTNLATGEVRSPYPDLQIERMQRYAFSGIHGFSPSLFPMMENWPEKFSIMDFYLSVCAHVEIRGIVQPNLRLLDVGKQDSLQAAEAWVAQQDY